MKDPVGYLSLFDHPLQFWYFVPVPVYFFSLHGRGQWMADHPRGYTDKKLGILPPDPERGRLWRRKMKQDPVHFTAHLQRFLIDAILAAAIYQELIVYAVGTESVHAHPLVGWRDGRRPVAIRAQLKRSMSRQLNVRVAAGQLEAPKHDGSGVRWFADGGSVKQVRDEDHLEYLLEQYIPDHPGWFWSRRSGFRPPTRPQ